MTLFIFAPKIKASEQKIVINKVLYDPTGADNKVGETLSYEMVELKNISEEAVNVGNWEIRLGAYMLLEKISTPIPSGGGVRIFFGNGEDSNLDFSEGKFASLYRNKTGSQLGDTKGEIALYDSVTNNESTIVDYVVYGKDFNFNTSTNFSHAKAKKLWKDGDTVEIFGEGCSMVLESKKNFDSLDWKAGCNSEEDENKKDSVIYADGIIITELFPNPFKSQYEEYIELYNGNSQDVVLKDWVLHDESKSGKYTFPVGILIKAKQYLAVFKKDFKFALNNSGQESVMLLDPNGKEVFKAQYDGSKRNVSYNFNGSRWRWSKFLTPGSENIFNNEPYGKVKIDKEIFENVYADFSVSTGDADGEKIKVVWDFGDKHKSYLSKTRHKYKKVGLYNVSVKFSDGSEDVVQNFAITVEEFPHPKVVIVKVNANPEGNDSDLETITIENKSKDKINLKDWSIAAGWKNLSNHPINKNIVIEKNKSKEISREYAAFALNNKKGKIELRYPDGEVASKIKYSKDGGIGEGDIYEKTKQNWTWKIATKKTAISSRANTGDVSLVHGESQLKEEEKEKIEEMIEPIAIVKENQFSSANNENIKIELLRSEFSSSVEDLRQVDGIYFFTSQTIIKEHYAIVFMKDIFYEINFRLNKILNF